MRYRSSPPVWLRVLDSASADDPFPKAMQTAAEAGRQSALLLDVVLSAALHTVCRVQPLAAGTTLPVLERTCERPP